MNTKIYKTERTEQQIEQAVVKYAKNHGWISYKFVSPSETGVPDRIFINNGVICFVEFKSAKGRITPKQNAVIKKMIAHKMFVFVCKSIPAGYFLFDEMYSFMINTTSPTYFVDAFQKKMNKL